MNIISQLKKNNNGSTLTLVLFMLFMLSVTAIAVITLTGSELRMSVMTSERSKALLAAKAGAENAAQIIDTAVAQAQEDAITKAKEAIQNEIKDPVSGQPVNIKGTLFEGVVDNSNANDIKILKERDWEDIYQSEYKYQFWKCIENIIVKLGSKLTVGNIDSGSYSYSNVNLVSSGSEVISRIKPSLSAQVNSITITSTGSYLSPSRGSTYKRSIKEEFSLLTTPKSDDIPVTYGKLTKVRINKDVKIPILDNKALIAEKNIISLNGTVEVTGKTVCFGTVPSNGDKIDYDIGNGYMFGGIIAGMVPDQNSNSGNYLSKLWTDSNIVSKGNNLKENMIDTLKLNANYFDFPHTGSFKFNDDVATMAYLHSLYSTDTSKSEIIVSGNTFASGVKVESEANYSQLKLNNVYTYDDLKIDANNSTVDIGAPNNEKVLVGMSRQSPYSTVIVSGDSKINIFGGVYVGGSTVYNEYINSDINSTEYKKPYASGMSIQKSDSRPAEAFLVYKDSSFPDNVFHFFDNDAYINKKAQKSDYEDLTVDNGNGKLKTSKYNSDTTEMMMERLGQNGKPKLITIMEKAMHLKYIWNNSWKDDVGYSSYFNTGDISIEPEIGDQIKGFCFGGVAANGTVYGPYNGFVNKDMNPDRTYSNGTENDYTMESTNGKNAYIRLMDLFLANPADLENPKHKSISDSIDKSALTSGTFNTYPLSNTYMLYKNGNVVLDNSTADGNSISGYRGGIILSTGDIYVKAETNNFKGILIAEGNIVFLGNAKIEYDKNVVDELLSEDPQIGRFFKHTLSDVIMNDPNAIIQTVKKKNVKNIKIISWKEI